MENNKKCENCIHYDMGKCESCIHNEVCNGALLYPKAELNCNHYKDKSLCEDRTPRKTNFEKITESTETLAEFITKVVNRCSFNECEECKLADIGCNNPKCLKEWLEKESE